MNRTDLSSCGKQHLHTPVSLRQPLRCGFTILLCSCLLFGASQCRAQETQDAAQAARQERTRREQSERLKHVYTEEDLGRAKILTPEDEARFAAQRKLQPTPGEKEIQAPLDALGVVPQLPLGDVARRYRDAKLAMQAPTPFRPPFDEPAFAAPVISIPKVAPPLPNYSASHPNFAPSQSSAVVAPAIGSAAPVQRVDPFARRSLPVAPRVAQVAPASPLAQPRISHAATFPAIPQPHVSKRFAAPEFAAPKISPRAAELDPAPAAISAPAVPRPNTAAAAAPPISASSTYSSPSRTLTVQPGDSLWKLAQQTLGRGSRWHELMAANPNIVDPAHLAAGTKIVVPNEVPTQTLVEPDRTIAVEKGDTLTKIAQARYGRAAAWACISQANPDITDPNRIYEGQQLLLPFHCKQ